MMVGSGITCHSPENAAFASSRNDDPRTVQKDRARHQRGSARSCPLIKGTPEFEQSSDERKKVEMRFAHLKTHHRFERMRSRLSGARDEFHPRCHRAEPQDHREPHLATAAEPVGRVPCLKHS